MPSAPKSSRVAIIGGGIAGLEALLAVRDLAGDRAELTLVAPRPDFVYKPLSVEEPFSGDPAKRHELSPLVKSLGGRFVLAAATQVRPDEHEVDLDDESMIGYDKLIVCLGARALAPFSQGFTLTEGERLNVSEILSRAARHPSRTLVVAIPPGASWPLPAYELALMARRRSTELGLGALRVQLVTPEQAPLLMFGRVASDAVGELLRSRRVEVRSNLRLSQAPGGELIGHPGQEPLDVGALISLPALAGPGLAGLPADENGFIPIDEHARVPELSDVYAAGDGTVFPVKQGGIATQQADAAAEHIAAALGAKVEPSAFHPVLRGQLLTGGDSLQMSHDLTGGHGDGLVSSDQLWWPPHKVSGRYLSPFLEHDSSRRDPRPPRQPLEVEASLAQEWHEQPMALDPLSPVNGGFAADREGDS
jgi:sulfide:quinone oxidoreductase